MLRVDETTAHAGNARARSVLTVVGADYCIAANAGTPIAASEGYELDDKR